MKDVQILVRRILTLAKSRGAKNDKASVFGAAETAAESFFAKAKKTFMKRDEHLWKSFSSCSKMVPEDDAFVT